MSEVFAVMWVFAVFFMPAFIGYSLFFTIAASKHNRMEVKIVASINGAWVAYVFFGVLLSGLELLRVNIFDGATLILVCLSIFAALILFKYCWSGFQSNFKQLDKNRCVFEVLFSSGLLFVLGVLSFFISSQLKIPVQSWDGLSHWYYFASEVVHHNTSESASNVFQIRGRAGRHPDTLPFLYAWFGFIGHKSNFEECVAALYLFFNFLILVQAYFAASYFLPKKKLELFYVWMIGTTALLQNHYLITGYAEIILGMGLMGAVTLFLMSQASAASLTSLILPLLLGMAAVKNVGIIFAAPVAVMMLCSRLMSCKYVTLRGGRWFHWGFLILLIMSLTLMERHFLDSGSVFLQRLFLRSEGSIGGGSIAEVFRNFSFAIFVNASFSLSALLAIFLSVGAFLGRGSLKDKNNITLLLVCSVPIALCVLLNSSQLFIPYAYEHAVPGNDTGGSRFNIPLVMCVLALLPYLMAQTFYKRVGSG